MTHRKIALAAVAVCALGLPTAAQARSKTVYMGPPPFATKGAPNVPADVDADFPKTITIHAGDKVSFAPLGFHNLEIPATGQDPAALFLPTGDKVSGANDANGDPFWFNGQDVIGFNPAVAAVNLFGKTATYKASKGLESGLPTQSKPKPFVVKFPKAGTFTYLCSVHPGMKGKVKVVRKGHKIPSAKADRKRIKKQGAAAVKVVKALAKKTSTGDNVSIGEAGAGGTELFAFVPDALTVPVGTTVTFSMPTGSLEDHTATAGPGDAEDDTTYLGKLAATFAAPVPDPAAVYPSDMPPAAASLTATSHGNGFWNSGVLDSQSATQLPAANTVKFTQAGTFTFYCLIHPFMKGTVTVQ
jgi:plastocyanin